MICDECKQPINYCFHIDNERWLKAVGKKEGHWCAHCILQSLEGLSWYIVWNEPLESVRLNVEREETQKGATS